MPSRGRIASVEFASEPGTHYDIGYGDSLARHLEFRAVVGQAHEPDPEGTRQYIEWLPEYLELYEEWTAGATNEH